MPYTMQQRHIKHLITTILLGFVSVTAVSCGDDEAQQESCSTTQSECSPDGTGYRICVSGYWSVAIPCLENQTCKNGQCYDVPQRESCTATQPVCLPDGTGYRVCVSGYWSDAIPCLGTQTCQNGQCSGEDITSKLPCKAGDKSRCVSESRIQICGADNFWRFMDCPPDIPVCRYNECNPPECTTGDMECIGEDTLAICIDSVWQRETCPSNKPLCQNKTCVELPKECTPGNKRCVSDKQGQTCDENGFWANTMFCASTGHFCFNGDCVEKCSPGEKKCVTDSMAYICDVNGNWKSIECTGDKVCNNGECKDCQNGEKRCVDQQTLGTCKNGNWQTSSCAYCSPNNKCLAIGYSCDSVFSFCSGIDLIWCDGSRLRTSQQDNNSCGCTQAKDNVGATCITNKQSPERIYQDSWDYYSLCSSVNAVMIDDDFGWAYYDSDISYKAKCLQCKKMTDGSQRWVPVDESNCI